ncbi:MAG: hypothetical protein GKR91_08955 [Pseudomonadales bacterium]|nr:hypothetical protein [Pseudomonadales bacterium]
MQPIDYLKALGLGIAVLVITVIASFPMVAFYSAFIEPGQPAEFYTEAAQWIAPWSSHVLGPIIFFFGAYRITKNNADLNGIAFAAMSIALYLVVDFGIIGLALGMPLAELISVSIVLSPIVKTIAAVMGAQLGTKNRQAVTNEEAI